ncbi:MAG TPA: hypothetical protein VE783_03845, partial [Candidatus Limnocylindrales bacterium]|nr:hypothetical protein [Candidatus Limnocylindrales bacterium]
MCRDCASNYARHFRGNSPCSQCNGRLHGRGTFDFATLNDAAAANSSGTITISGTCTEAVVLAGASNLTIIGANGASLVDPGDAVPNFGAVLEIDDSQNINV